MIRRRYRFFGTVQGVGFRYRAKYAASLQGVTGYVRNEWDGSVTLEVQGRPEAIEAMVDEILAGRFIQVEDLTREELPPLEDERRFRVEY